MKILLLIFVLAFASCTKEAVPERPASTQTYMFKIESVDVDGKVLYSPIVMHKL